MLETHAFGNFVPPSARFLILGSFTGKQAVKGDSAALFTSRFVETGFKKNFKDIVSHHPSIELITLPSPSSRYARMSKEQKVSRYKELLPSP
jgi:G:T/U-mismatch repair DNA glycosylase